MPRMPQPRSIKKSDGKVDIYEEPICHYCDKYLSNCKCP